MKVVLIYLKKMEFFLTLFVRKFSIRRIIHRGVLEGDEKSRGFSPFYELLRALLLPQHYYVLIFD